MLNGYTFLQDEFRIYTFHLCNNYASQNGKVTNLILYDNVIITYYVYTDTVVN